MTTPPADGLPSPRGTGLDRVDPIEALVVDPSGGC
jgi:hypothetical protein